MEIKVGDKVTINSKWLEACGMLRYDGYSWTVTKVTTYRDNNIFYEVASDLDGWTWTAWNYRGVTKVGE